MSYKIKTTPKKKELSLRLRDQRREEPRPQASQFSPDDDMESDLPIRGRPSKKLLLQQQQRQHYHVKLQPDIKTVAVGATGSSYETGPPSDPESPTSSGGMRLKARRSLYKRGGTIGGSQKSPGESYVMRLFERSLDLSRYEENTPLYPICRAWMANQPRNPLVANYSTESSASGVKREDNGEEILEKLRSGEIKVLTALPQPRPTDLPIIPPRLEFGREERQRERALQGAGRSELMAANMSRWKKVRSHWLKHSQKYEAERYELIDEIMDVICKN
ncbi:hypothetical protein KR018_002514 [Drosophila ironensis]|nr:hypothetical protein KR018_002514 [Drosophila ironensis]